MRKIRTLKKNYEFKNVMSRGKFFCGNYITVYISKNNIEKNVIGIAVNTKVAKAVKRNRIKRLIRENYRLNKNNLQQGYNIVFLWNQKRKPTEANFKDIQKDMNYIFKRAKMFLNE